MQFFFSQLLFGIEKDNSKKYEFGFGLGTNYPMIHSSTGTSENNYELKTSAGFVVSLVMDYNFTKRLSFSPKFELAFNNIKLSHNSEEQTIITFPSDVELMCHVYYDIIQGINSIYLLVGSNYRLPLNFENEWTTNSGFYIDFGLGLKHQYKLLSISPELRYSRGLNNIKNNVEYPDFSLNKISLVLYFK